MNYILGALCKIHTFAKKWPPLINMHINDSTYYVTGHPSLALDPSGSRVISGSADYELKFWDFAGNMIDLYSNIIHSSREGFRVQVFLMSSVHLYITSVHMWKMIYKVSFVLHFTRVKNIMEILL